ncbi:AGAP009320-PA [Anopheles gambiae str. PEST]|uniref:AGAP009320-PA n=1 Tax=Anopheles gambiae TaxID=7165 RepID=A0NC48_ANOGA|nr:AGAP009320-PA [Anopheles gambiae str. PEST]
MWEKRYENRRLKAVAFCVLLAVSTMLPSTDALKTKSRSKSSSSSSSSGRVSKPSSTSYSNPGSLSYSNYQSKPAPKPAPKPSAPVDTSNQRNIGWNVNNQAKPAGSVAQPAVNKPPPYPVQSNAAKPPYPVQSNAGKPPYPVQQHSNTHQTHAAPGGPPPPYSHGPPPPFGQPMGGYGGAGGYHPQGAGFGAPHGTFQGGGYAPPVNYAPQPSFPIAAIPVGAYKPQSSGLGVGGIAAGIGTGLLAGAAGSALYNALRPEDPAAPVPNSPPASGAADGSSNVPLAPMPGSSDNANPNAPNVPVQTDPMETTTVDPNAKQYIPPPGQYYPATGQYVPPGEYDPATGIFTPGRYIAETNIFQSGLYDPLSQMFTPGRYDATGQFIADPDNPPLSLAPNSGAAPAAQPETVTPAVASQFKTTSGANMPPISNLLVALGAVFLSFIARF